jgi:hypothetical protein
MITFLIFILILCLVFGVLAWVIQQLPIPAPFGNIALAVLGLIFILIIIGVLLGDMPLPRPMLR